MRACTHICVYKRDSCDVFLLLFVVSFQFKWTIFGRNDRLRISKACTVEHNRPSKNHARVTGNHYTTRAQHMASLSHHFLLIIITRKSTNINVLINYVSNDILYIYIYIVYSIVLQRSFLWGMTGKGLHRPAVIAEFIYGPTSIEMTLHWAFEVYTELMHIIILTISSCHLLPVV